MHVSNLTQRSDVPHQEPLCLGNRGYCIPYPGLFFTFPSSSNVGNLAGCRESDEQGAEGDSSPAFKAWNNTTPSRCFRAALSGTGVFTCRRFSPRRSPAPPLVCSASSPHHVQPCVFPGWLCVNSSHSHTFPHTDDTHAKSHQSVSCCGPPLLILT